MRDVERLRAKVEFSLEERQVWALSLSALLLLTGVFTIGLLVGRKTAPAAPAVAGDLAALDAAAQPPQPAAPAKPAPAPALSSVVPAAPERHEAEAEKKDAPRAPEKAPPPRAALTVPPPPRPVQVAPANPVALTPPPREVGEYTVQIGSSQERSEAARLESKARAAGLRPYVVSADLGAKGTWYRVRVGSFRDRDAAARYRKDVERELRGNAVVMPTH